MVQSSPLPTLRLLQCLWWLVCWCIITGHYSCALHIPTKYHPQSTTSKRHINLLSWGVEIVYDPRSHSIHQIDQIADSIAHDIGLVNVGRIGTLQGLYQMDHTIHNKHFQENILLTYLRDSASNSSKPNIPVNWRIVEMDAVRWKRHFEQVLHGLETHGKVSWFTQLHAFQRQKRALLFKDPAFPRQWHLVNRQRKGHDLNIMRVWERNVTGKGVVAAVVDDGLEWTNPDIRPNYFADASYDINNYDGDPMPSFSDKTNHHGTRCAGEIAAAANGVCAVGVAFNARIAGLKVLDGPMTDSLEGIAFSRGKDLIDVYSCSWGPDDDGKTVDGPQHIALRALREAVNYGRKGYGNVFVVASGNGGMKGDNCNFDGYANSIYTVTIGAVNEDGAMPYYAEECASMLAVTYSSGGRSLRSIVTTDWRSGKGTGCTNDHTGTSAAAPLAAGMIALMLQARPCLTWRDVQHIIVMAAVKVDIDVAHWTRNKAGLHHSHKHGFGLMDAWRLVNAAKLWHPVPWMTLFSTEEVVENAPIPVHNNGLKLTYTVDASLLDGYNLITLEYIHIIVMLEHAHRGSLEIRLICPSGTESTLAAIRPEDDSTDGFNRWTFSTVRCWGEQPEGDWVLHVQDKGVDVEESRGVFQMYQLKLYGSAMSPADVKKRRKSVATSASGEKLYDNFSLPCPPPPQLNIPVNVISEKNLKVLVLASAFLVIMAIYESLEYIFCFDDAKKRHIEERKAAMQSNIGSQNIDPADADQSGVGDMDEQTGLLEPSEERVQIDMPVGEHTAETVLPGPSCGNMQTMQLEAAQTLNHHSKTDGFAGKAKHFISHIWQGDGSRRNKRYRYSPLPHLDQLSTTDDACGEEGMFTATTTLGRGHSQAFSNDICHVYKTSSSIVPSVIPQSEPGIATHSKAVE